MLPALRLGLIVPGLAACALSWPRAITRGDEGAPPPAATNVEAPLVYEDDVAPIFAAHCLECHGEEAPEAGLNLSSAAGLLAGGESGPIVLAGRPEDSHLMEMIRDGAMPPDEDVRLSNDEIDRIRRWIAAGARFKDSSLAASGVTQHDIVPLMHLRCAACHGGRTQEAGLDLRTKAAMLGGGKSGPAAVPGKPEESLLLRRIHAGEMPPRRLLVSASVKPMTESEIERLTAWIAADMPEFTQPLDVAGTQPDRLVTDEDRDFWAFRPPVRPMVPALEDAAERAVALAPLDAFLAQQLRERGLRLSPPADRGTLIRRLYLDLLGLPPSPEDVQSFLADDHPLAYEKLVDRLLASPHYGERWGRHWLDAAGYSDSEGAQNEDRLRPQTWRYRDYVIRAFNADKPYDRFLHEQLAGDELADYETAPEITEELYDNLVATGFLRTAPDRTFADITNFVPDRLELIAEEMQVFGSAVLGLTLHCARCHSHKFDPIPQRDYYRLLATFKDAFDEHDWLKPEVRTLPHVTTGEAERHRAETARIAAKIDELKQCMADAADETAKAKLGESIAQLEAQRPSPPSLRALWSRGDPSPTYILLRGDYLRPGREVGPGVPAVLTDGQTPFEVAPPWPGAKQTGRRLALARWLTRPDHPLTARVMVNRVWLHHFGRGLVATPENFGVAGARPSHPELLDWLTTDLVRSDWSLKHLHRLILTSAAWRQQSAVTEDRHRQDPDNVLVSRMTLRRLEGEALWDGLIRVAGELDVRPFGPPDAVDVRDDGLVTARPSLSGYRRSVYGLQRRTTLPTLLENFDLPRMNPNCTRRGESIVATQALHLLNNAQVLHLAERFAERIRREAGDDPQAQVERAYLVAFARPPNDEERAAAVESLQGLRAAWQEDLTAQSPAADAAAISNQAAAAALAGYCHALLNSAAFVFVD